jgi:anthranilate phosphoribosyltransferase
LRAVLGGTGSKAETDIVILNAAALLYTAGRAESLKDAADVARESLLTGKSAKLLNAFIEASNS